MTRKSQEVCLRNRFVSMHVDSSKESRAQAHGPGPWQSCNSARIRLVAAVVEPDLISAVRTRAHGIHNRVRDRVMHKANMSIGKQHVRSATMEAEGLVVRAAVMDGPA